MVSLSGYPLANIAKQIFSFEYSNLFILGKLKVFHMGAPILVSTT